MIWAPSVMASVASVHIVFVVFLHGRPYYWAYEKDSCEDIETYGH